MDDQLRDRVVSCLRRIERQMALCVAGCEMYLGTGQEPVRYSHAPGCEVAELIEELTSSEASREV